jgi:hypothetical protein
MEKAIVTGSNNTHIGNIGNLTTKSGFKTKAMELSWRRSKVIEMKAKGLSQIEISQQLQVSDTAIGCDIAYLRDHAKQNVKDYVTKTLPLQYQICLAALDLTIKNTYKIIENTEDTIDKIDALDFFNQVHFIKLRLLLNSNTLDTAVNFLENNQLQQQQQEQDQEQEVLSRSTTNVLR